MPLARLAGPTELAMASGSTGTSGTSDFPSSAPFETSTASGSLAVIPSAEATRASSPARVIDSRSPHAALTRSMSPSKATVSSRRTVAMSTNSEPACSPPDPASPSISSPEGAEVEGNTTAVEAVVSGTSDAVEVGIVSAAATSSTVVPTSTVEVEAGAPLPEPLLPHDPAINAHTATVPANLMAVQ